MNHSSTPAAEHLSAAIRIPTISGRDGRPLEPERFLSFHRFLQDSYPLCHSRMTREAVDTYSLLYHCPGSDASLEPFCVMAHMDVVPVDKRTESQWQHPAFSGEIADGYVWGRGALDMKGQLISIFEALEALFKKGFSPRRGFYVALSHNEEIMSETASGALEIVRTLKSRGIHLSFVLDEGGNFFPKERFHTDLPVVLLGICERGYADVRLSAVSGGGHSSTPPVHTALGRLCAAVAAIEDHPLPAFWNPAAATMFDSLAPHMEEPFKTLFCDRKAHLQQATDVLSESPFDRALIACTSAATMAEGSTAPNVLPGEASVTFNLRISPTATVEHALSHMRALAGEDITFTELTHIEPSPISPTDGFGYETVLSALKVAFPDYLPIPGPVIMGTDSRHFYAVSGCVYHVTPFPCFIQDGNRLHTVNERMCLDSLSEGVHFFEILLSNAAK